MSATSTNDNNTKLTESPIASAADTPPTDEHLKKRNKKDLNNNRKRLAPYTIHSSTINSENSKKKFTKK